MDNVEYMRHSTNSNRKSGLPQAADGLWLLESGVLRIQSCRVALPGHPFPVQLAQIQNNDLRLRTIGVVKVTVRWGCEGDGGKDVGKASSGEEAKSTIMEMMVEVVLSDHAGDSRRSWNDGAEGSFTSEIKIGSWSKNFRFISKRNNGQFCPVKPPTDNAIIKRSNPHNHIIQQAYMNELNTLTSPFESCDTSLLLDSTRKTLSEKETDRSFGMRNFRYLEEIKDAVERECPGVVLCADILVLSARDGIIVGDDMDSDGKFDGKLLSWLIRYHEKTRNLAEFKYWTPPRLILKIKSTNTIGIGIERSSTLCHTWKRYKKNADDHQPGVYRIPILGQVIIQKPKPPRDYTPRPAEPPRHVRVLHPRQALLQYISASPPEILHHLHGCFQKPLQLVLHALLRHNAILMSVVPLTDHTPIEIRRISLRLAADGRILNPAFPHQTSQLLLPRH
ncbi:hypothetical protein IEQ34_002252 [Dendrobium chrysotoxum]|uniref:Plant heme peroxidase family profile domain-containing protein n=1 Tax=Dendrobium chrysotoxum TaxID=161865 RepID=A0AAV7H4F7_DENCH|nr:hypothetical protein IEQ34_002252 [Dendrobium chrysotoxum]